MEIPVPLMTLSGEYMLSIIFVGIGLFVLALIVAIELLRHFRNTERMKYEFITIIAHTFQTPLTQIKWIAENIKSDATNQYTKEQMAELQKANERLIGLTGTLIEMTDTDNTARSSYHIEHIDVCELVKAQADSLKNIYREKNISFSVRCTEHPAIVRGDKIRLEFVIQVMLTNAFSYTPVGKEVYAYVHIEHGKAVCTIKDTGIGIDHKDISHVGTKFFRAKNSQEMNTDGCGVSLYLADAIVRRHRGHMFIHSDGIGKGTEVTVVLPKIN